MIYVSCLENGVFLCISEMTDFVRIRKRESKQLVRNHRPVLLLPICDKTWTSNL